MSNIAKLFMSGRSQALRLPGRFRMDASEVRIEPLADGYWIQPVKADCTTPQQWLAAFFANTPRLPDTFLSDRDDSSPQERDWL